MTDSIYIQLLDIYQHISQADIQTGKNYVLRRESAANGLASLISALLRDAAEKITTLCYVYNIDPKTFTISASYNTKLYEEIAKILDELDDEIMDLVLDYSMRCTESEKRRSSLLPWILALGWKNRTMREILQNRLWMFSRDLEAMVVATRLAGHNMGKAINRIKSNLSSVYSMPEMQAAFRHKAEVRATYIRSNGVKKGNVGNSNSEANNIERFAKMTVQKTWMHNQQINYEERGAEGYMVFRGSTFDCPYCDSFCNIFHPIEDTKSFPPFHGNCCCYTVPVFKAQ